MKDLSLHLMDIAQNSIAAGAEQIDISISIPEQSGKLIFEIADDGKGMDSDFLQKVADPFKTSRKTREVGLGIPLLKQSAELTGGELVIRSEPQKGTILKAIFGIDHIDRIPLGDIAGTVRLLIAANPEIVWNVRFSSQKDCFELNTEEIKSQLDGVPLDNYHVLDWIQNTIFEGAKLVFGGVLDEVH